MKTCPFCGGNGKLSRRQLRFRGQYDTSEKVIRMAVQVICQKCKARGPVVTETVTDPYFTGKNVMEIMDDIAVTYWNERGANNAD